MNNELAETITETIKNELNKAQKKTTELTAKITQLEELKTRTETKLTELEQRYLHQHP